MDGEGQRQSKYQGDNTASYEEERCVQQEKNVRQPANVSSSISMIPGCRKIDQRRERHAEISSKVKVVDVNDIGRCVSDLMQGKFSCQTNEIGSEIVSYKKNQIDW